MPPRLLFFFSAHTLMQSQPKHLEGRTAPSRLARSVAQGTSREMYKPSHFCILCKYPKDSWKGQWNYIFHTSKRCSSFYYRLSCVSLYIEIFIPRPQKETLFGNKAHNVISYDKNHWGGKFSRKQVDMNLSIGKVPQWGGCWSLSHQAGHRIGFLYPFPLCPRACYITRKVSVRGHCHYFHFKHRRSIFLSLYLVKTNSAT